MKLVVIGGHLSPALSVIEAMPKDAKILFVGRKYSFEGDKAVSLEYKTIQSLSIQFSEITSGRLQRKFTRYTINSLLKFPIGIIQSFFILRKFKPDVVIGFGGYVSLAVGICAFLMRIPVVIHEQTLEAGFANKIISIFAKKICISWDSSFKYFPRSKTVLTGNPNRHSGKRSASRIANVMGDAGQASMTGLYDMGKKLPIIYITGGSTGSHFINTLVEGCIRQLLDKFIVIHQTGDAQKHNDFVHLQNQRERLSSELKARYTITKFVEPSQVGFILENCDLVISRAGVNIITELIYFEKPAILIPLPFSQREEQLKNARFFEMHKLGEVILQNEIDSEMLYNKVTSMFDNIGKYKLDKGRSGLPRREAAKNIIKVIEYVGKQKKDS